jgi:hypothetical protein
MVSPEATSTGSTTATPARVDRLQRFDPARVLFAHDLAVWEPRP